MSERPPLKLKLSMAKVPKSEPQDLPPHPPPSASTPTATPSIKLKLGKKPLSATPAPQAPRSSAQAPGTTKPKPARKPKPTPKKRALEEDPVTSSDDEAPLASKSTPGHARKKLRLSVGTKPQFVHFKAKRKLPKRPLGVGYDSEASDREEDPVITEAIILRMAPGDDCDYLRSAVAAGNLGKEVRFRFLRDDGRRACVTVRGNHYAAILVDLPCVIEAMKSWFPKTGWIKSADICQMLLVLGRIKEEQDALHYPLPLGTKGEFDEKTWQWAHGLTPPMHWVRKRRFRNRVSVRTVMEVEAEVEEMLRLDALAEGEPIIEEIYDRPNRGSDLASDDDENFDNEEEGEDEDAEGDFVDDQQYPQAETPLDTIEGAEDEEAAHARMAEEYEREMMLAIGDPADPASSPPLDPLLNSTNPSFDSPAAGATPPSLAATPSAAMTPAVAAAASSPEPESSDEDDEDLDEDQLEQQQELQQLKDEVREVDELIKAEQAKLAATGNQLLKKRIVDKIKGLQQDRELKLAAAGQGE